MGAVTRDLIIRDLGTAILLIVSNGPGWSLNSILGGETLDDNYAALFEIDNITNTAQAARARLAKEALARFNMSTPALDSF